MGPFYVLSMLTLTTMTVMADDAQLPGRVIQRVLADVEADLGRTERTEPPSSGEFSPLQRARQQLGSWTRVPDRQKLGRRSPQSPPVPAALPGSTTSEYFPLVGTSLQFPTTPETADAIRRMARGQVSSVPHYCARSVREALGWGLGDAHQWTRLPERGYSERPPGHARPGDIVVWSFNFGRNNRQHIGFAVATPAGLKLLSNMNGVIKVSALLPGYRAYWK